MCMIHQGYNLDDNKWQPLAVSVFTLVNDKLLDNSIDSEVKQVCIMAAADVVSVCHKLLGDEKVQMMVNLLFE